ncbi:ribosomal protein S18 acetylase RimI-like enzyme [Duganella sp. 1224]|uniref:GNAT family N-acetyltransferase n=1 Tax=Duganella sp. 1224 TaxID=2587052 RepID=UPI0015CDCBF2|nr:GNAT family N-acetyltransferase [Duganella sp. 1224]NYE61885.1 ribosomal protein S18 acetylase RimI-like enzyme [Duganella sp. 1224]
MSILLSFRRLGARLRAASPRSIAAGAAVLIAAIFLLDVGSGPTISFGLFYTLAVVLVAWRLGPGATALAVLGASVARVADFYLTRHHDSPPMLVYDLLQSAAGYGLAALLAWQGRLLFERTARHARSFQRQARRERRRRRLESTIRRAVLADVPAIIALTNAGGEDGAFDQRVQDAVHQAALSNSFSQGIIEGAALRDVWHGGQTVVPIEFWVSEIDGQLAAYMMVLGLDGNKGPERELHALAVAPAQRGAGLGSVMVNFFCTRYQQRRLVVASKAGSQMMQMLQRRHFQQLSSDKGYDIMVRD